MAILYVIRHGATEAEGVMPGAGDPPLSARGRDDVRRALASIEVPVVYTSPARRARETAACIGGALHEIPALREVDYGQWSGLRWDEIEARWSDLAAAKKKDWLGVAPPGGETWADVIGRAAEVLQTIRRTPAAAVAVVAHQGINAALMQIIDGRNPLDFVQRYGEVIRVAFD